MGRFKLNKPNGDVVWVKSIDKVNETLEFTQTRTKLTTETVTSTHALSLTSSSSTSRTSIQKLKT